MDKKKFLLAIIIFVLLTAGFFYWQAGNNQSPHKNSDVQANNQTVAKQTAKNQTVEKNLIEIFYLPHPPALAIVQKVEPIIAEFPNFKVVKYNFDDPASKNKITAYHLINHSPIAIFIGGKNSFTINGKTVSLINFPQGDAFIPSYEGSWTYEDLKTILSDLQ